MFTAYIAVCDYRRILKSVPRATLVEIFANANIIKFHSTFYLLVLIFYTRMNLSNNFLDIKFTTFAIFFIQIVAIEM